MGGAGCDILNGEARAGSHYHMPMRAEGRVACPWQVVNCFNSVTDELGSERTPLMTADISLSDAPHAHTQTHNLTAKSHKIWLVSFDPHTK